MWPESLDSFVSSSRQGLMKLLELDTHMMEHTLLFIQCPVHTGFKISWGLVLHFSRKDVICLCCGGNDKGFGAVILPIPKKSNMYQYLKCIAILISIQNVGKY